MKIVIATKNLHKVKEISAILADVPSHEFFSLQAYPEAPDVHEDQPTLEGNAAKKALEMANYTGEITIADDSGLEVDALNGAPGVYSARYAGPGATYQQLCAKLLHELKNVPDAQRTARFRTVIAVAKPGQVLHILDGHCDGRIIHELRGTQGFGYDPVFLYEPLNKTFAELSETEKNQVSHRANALQKLKNVLPNL